MQRKNLLPHLAYMVLFERPKKQTLLSKEVELSAEPLPGYGIVSITSRLKETSRKMFIQGASAHNLSQPIMSGADSALDLEQLDSHVLVAGSTTCFELREGAYDIYLSDIEGHLRSDTIRFTVQNSQKVALVCGSNLNLWNKLILVLKLGLTKSRCVSSRRFMYLHLLAD